MVTFAELRSAKPGLWTTAANDFLNAAKQCERVKDDIHNNGVAPLSNDWADHAGTLAVDTLNSIAGRAEVSAVLARSTVDPVDTLAHAVTIAQNELENGVRTAESLGCSVDPATGSVSIPATAVANGTDLAKMQAIGSAQQLINDAIEAATQADGECTKALQETNRNSGTNDLQQAQTVQADATKDALKELRQTLPDGLRPNEVASWWNHLTPQEQYDLERACPVELFNLNGIPESVKQEIDRKDQLGYSSVGTVQYALANVDNKKLDNFPDDCTNFVSDSLRYGGGLSEHRSGFGLEPPKFDRGGWSDSEVGAEGDTHWSYTPSWAAAQNNRDFFLSHGGTVVDQSQARPGDIVYFTETQADPVHGLSPNETHHAAVVTGVLPDGQVLYTQHSDSAANYPLNGRLPAFEQSYGQQRIEIVQPKMMW
jgi:Putative amidase domain